MKNIPAWIIKALKKETVKCHYCKEIFGDRSITAVGIRKGQDLENKEFLFVELFCKKCNKTNFVWIDRDVFRGIGLWDIGNRWKFGYRRIVWYIRNGSGNYVLKEQDKP